MEFLIMTGAVVLNIIVQFVLGLNFYKFCKCEKQAYDTAYKSAYINAFKEVTKED